MKRTSILVLGLVGVLACCQAFGSAQPPGEGGAGELSSKPWLYEVMRHVYRWYVDEKDIDAVVKADEVVFKVRELKPKLDEGDKSRFGEVLLPQFGLRIKVKMADYTVPELNTAVKTDTFKVVSVAPLSAMEPAAAGCTEVRAVYTEMRDHLFKTRAQASFPEGELLERMRGAIRGEIVKEYAARKAVVPEGVQTVYLASLSPVANEAWVYWENGKMLIRFASDIDLSSPAVWTHETLAVSLYPLERKVVVSLDEVNGSNAFMTRSQAGRGLFNCVVLGKKLELTPGVPAAAPK